MDASEAVPIASGDPWRSNPFTVLTATVLGVSGVSVSPSVPLTLVGSIIKFGANHKMSSQARWDLELMISRSLLVALNEGFTQAWPEVAERLQRHAVAEEMTYASRASSFLRGRRAMPFRPIAAGTAATIAGWTGDATVDAKFATTRSLPQHLVRLHHDTMEDFFEGDPATTNDYGILAATFSIALFTEIVDNLESTLGTRKTSSTDRTGVPLDRDQIEFDNKYLDALGELSIGAASQLVDEVRRSSSGRLKSVHEWLGAVRLCATEHRLTLQFEETRYRMDQHAESTLNAIADISDVSERSLSVTSFRTTLSDFLTRRVTVPIARQIIGVVAAASTLLGLDATGLVIGPIDFNEVSDAPAHLIDFAKEVGARIRD